MAPDKLAGCKAVASGMFYYLVELLARFRAVFLAGFLAFFFAGFLADPLAGPALEPTTTESLRKLLAILDEVRNALFDDRSNRLSC
jgi:hypothetical protein